MAIPLQRRILNRRMNGKIQYFVLIAIVLPGLFLRLFHLDARGLWTDEKMSLHCAYGIRGFAPDSFGMDNRKVFSSSGFEKYFNPQRVVQATIADNGNGLAHNLSQHYWIRMFGSSDFSIRMLPVVFSLATVVLSFFLLRMISGRSDAGLIASGFLAIHPLLIEHSQSARMYSMAMFFSLLSVFFFCRIMYRNASLAGGILLGLAAGIAFLSHYFTGFFLPAFAIAFAISPGTKKNWIACIAAAGAFIVIFTIWMSSGGMEGIEMMQEQNTNIALASGAVDDSPAGESTLTSAATGVIKIAVRWLGLGIRDGILVFLTFLAAGAMIFTGRKFIAGNRAAWLLLFVPIIYLLSVSVIAWTSGHTTSFLLRYALIGTPVVAGILSLAFVRGIVKAGWHRMIAICGFLILLGISGTTLALRTYHDTSNGEVMSEDRESNPFVSLRNEIAAKYREGDTLYFQEHSDAVIENFYLRDRPDIVQCWDSTLQKGEILIAGPGGRKFSLQNMNGRRY